MIFQGVRTPCPPSRSAHGMHLKEGTCLKCSFQRVVIIGRKELLLCMFAPDHARRTIFWIPSSRDCTVFAHESFVLAWFLKISKHNVWVSQSILLQLLPMRTQNSNLPRRAHRLLYGKVGHPTVLTLCVLSTACSHF